MAVRTFTWKKTRSTATTAGRSSAISVARSARRVASRWGRSSVAGVVSTPIAIVRMVRRGPGSRQA